MVSCIFAFVLFHGLETTQPTPISFFLPLISEFPGGGFLTIKLSGKKRKLQNYQRKVCDKDFPEKNIFLRASRRLRQGTEKETNKQTNFPGTFCWNPNTISFSCQLRTIHGSRYQRKVCDKDFPDLQVPRDCVAEWWFIHVKKTKEVESRSTPKERKIQHLVKHINQIWKKISMRTSEETKRDRDLWQKWRLVQKILSNVDLVSNLLHPRVN